MTNARTIAIELSTNARDLVADLGLDEAAFLNDVAARAAGKMDATVEVSWGRISQNVIEIQEDGRTFPQGHHPSHPTEEAEILSQIVTDALGA